MLARRSLARHARLTCMRPDVRAPSSQVKASVSRALKPASPSIRACASAALCRYRMSTWVRQVTASPKSSGFESSEITSSHCAPCSICAHLHRTTFFMHWT